MLSNNLSSTITMERFRLFINRYIAEDDMAFTAAEFTAAVIVSACVSLGLIVICCIGM